MTYSNLIDLTELLNREDVVVIRRSPIFPNYETYSDVDIIGLDLKISEKRIIDKYIKKYHPHGYSYCVNGHHLDFFPPGFKCLDLRFDFMKSFECYNQFKIKSEFYQYVIDRSVVIDYNGLKIHVPSTADEVVLRYLEYMLHPTKKRHKKYAINNKSAAFIDTLHKFTGISYV